LRCASCGSCGRRTRAETGSASCCSAAEVYTAAA
jgi:hypothetical protein